MLRRRTLSVAVAVLITTITVLAPPSGAAINRSAGTSCWQNTGVACFVSDCLFFGTLYRNICTDSPLMCVCSRGGFAPTAILGPYGGQVQISGHAVCAEGAVAELRVTISQRGTGAVAEGTTRIACTGGEASWEIQGAIVGRSVFVAGEATVCGLLKTGGLKDPSDAFQWCREGVTLAEP